MVQRFGRARYQIAVRRFHDQRFEQVAQDIRPGHALRTMRVERLRLGAVVFAQRLIRREFGAARAANLAVIARRRIRVAIVTAGASSTSSKKD